MTGAISPPIEGRLTIQRNTNMLKILKKCVFVDFIGFFAEMQSPDCPPDGPRDKKGTKNLSLLCHSGTSGGGQKTILETKSDEIQTSINMA